MNVGLPDTEAQNLWDRVARASDAVAHTFADIARMTVAGEQTRSDLLHSAELLEEVASVLGTTDRREQHTHGERARLLGDEPGDAGVRS